MTYQSTQETYSPVGRRNRRMYWSGVQSTGADIKKYFTGDGQRWYPTGKKRLTTYSYRLAEVQLEHPGVSFVEPQCSA